MKKQIKKTTKKINTLLVKLFLTAVTIIGLIFVGSMMLKGINIVLQNPSFFEGLLIVGLIIIGIYSFKNCFKTIKNLK